MQKFKSEQAFKNGPKQPTGAEAEEKKSLSSKNKEKIARTLKNIYPEILKSSSHLVSSSILNQKIMSRNMNSNYLPSQSGPEKNPELAKKITLNLASARLKNELIKQQGEELVFKSGL